LAGEAFDFLFVDLGELVGRVGPGGRHVEVALEAAELPVGGSSDRVEFELVAGSEGFGYFCPVPADQFGKRLLQPVVFSMYAVQIGRKR